MSASADTTSAGTVAAGDVLLRVENLVKYFPVKSGKLFQGQRDFVHAVDGVSFEVRKGQTMGLVGETGCGKSTVARCISRLYDITSGRIEFEGHDLSHLSPRRMRRAMASARQSAACAKVSARSSPPVRASGTSGNRTWSPLPSSSRRNVAG